MIGTAQWTVDMRACALKAVHSRRHQLIKDIETLTKLGDDDYVRKVEILSTRHEIQCLQSVAEILAAET